MKKILAFLFIVLPVTATAGISFGELDNACRAAVHLAEMPRNAPDRKDIHLAVQSEKCWSYLSSFQEALAWSAIKNAGKDKKTALKDIVAYLPFCIPDSVSLKQQALLLINHAEKTPAHAKWPAGAVFGELMLNSFPCSK